MRRVVVGMLLKRCWRFGKSTQFVSGNGFRCTSNSVYEAEGFRFDP